MNIRLKWCEKPQQNRSRLRVPYLFVLLILYCFLFIVFLLLFLIYFLPCVVLTDWSRVKREDEDARGWGSEGVRGWGFPSVGCEAFKYKEMEWIIFPTGLWPTSVSVTKTHTCVCVCVSVCVWLMAEGFLTFRCFPPKLQWVGKTIISDRFQCQWNHGWEQSEHRAAAVELRAVRTVAGVKCWWGRSRGRRQRNLTETHDRSLFCPCCGRRLQTAVTESLPSTRCSS